MDTCMGPNSWWDQTQVEQLHLLRVSKAKRSNMDLSRERPNSRTIQNLLFVIFPNLSLWLILFVFQNALQKEPALDPERCESCYGAETKDLT